MTELSSDAERLLRMGRAAFSPDPARLEATREALRHKLSTQPPTGPHTDTPDGTSEPPAFAGSRAPLGPAAIGAGVAGLVVLAGLVGLFVFSTPEARPPQTAGVSSSPSPAVSGQAQEAARGMKAEQAPAREQPEDLGGGRAEGDRAPQPASQVGSERAQRPHRGRAHGGARQRLDRGQASFDSSRGGADSARLGAVPIAGPAPTRSDEAEQTRASDPQASARAPERPEQAQATPASGEGAPVRPSADTVARETELMRKARAALAGGLHEQALAILSAHEREFPRGVLSQERLALRARALCGLGRLDEGRAALAQLSELAPRSPHLAQLEAACKTGK